MRRTGVAYPPVGNGAVFAFRANSAGAELVSFAPLAVSTYNSHGFNYHLNVEVAAVNRPPAQP